MLKYMVMFMYLVWLAMTNDEINQLDGVQDESFVDTVKGILQFM